MFVVTFTVELDRATIKTPEDAIAEAIYLVSEDSGMVNTEVVEYDEEGPV